MDCWRFKMLDITEHKWSDYLINERDGAKPKGDLLEIHHEGDYSNSEAITLNTDDSTAIAKHFYDRMTDREQRDFFHTMNDEPQSETDYLHSTLANKQRLEESINQLDQGKTIKPFLFGMSEEEYTSQHEDIVKYVEGGGRDIYVFGESSIEYEGPEVNPFERILQSETSYTAVSNKLKLTPEQLKGAAISVGSPDVVFVINSEIGGVNNG